jgi:hypothetical protein
MHRCGAQPEYSSRVCAPSFVCEQRSAPSTHWSAPTTHLQEASDRHLHVASGGGGGAAAQRVVEQDPTKVAQEVGGWVKSLPATGRADTM